jgi:hypothetical protein
MHDERVQSQLDTVGGAEISTNRPAQSCQTGGGRQSWVSMGEAFNGGIIAGRGSMPCINGGTGLRMG